LRAAATRAHRCGLGVLLTVLNIAWQRGVFITGLGPFPRLGHRRRRGRHHRPGLVVSGIAGYLLFSGRLPVTWHRGMSWRPIGASSRSCFASGCPPAFQGIRDDNAGVLLLRFIARWRRARRHRPPTRWATRSSSPHHVDVGGVMSAAATVGGQNLGLAVPSAQCTACTPRRGWASASRPAIGICSSRSPAPPRHLRMTNPWWSGLGVQFSLPQCLGAVSSPSPSRTRGDSRARATRARRSTSRSCPRSWLAARLCTLFQATRGLRPPTIWTAILLGHITRGALSVRGSAREVARHQSNGGAGAPVGASRPMMRRQPRA